MIKALAQGRVILGLTDENIKRMRAGQPVAINLSDLGLPDQSICIMYGKDEQAIADELRQYITKETIIHDERG